MGKAVGFGLMVILAIYAAAAVVAMAVWMVLVVALFVTIIVLVLRAFCVAAQQGNIREKGPKLAMALISPIALMLICGALSWQLGIAQAFATGAHNQEGFAGFLALTVLYLGAYGLAVVMPFFGTGYAVWAVHEQNNLKVFYFVAVLSALAGFFSGGLGHMIGWIEWSNGGPEPF